MQISTESLLSPCGVMPAGINGAMVKWREEVLESLSQAAIERLSKLTESVIEEHVLLLSDIRRKMIALNDPKEVKRYSSQVDALLKCIKGERTALGLPNHIVGMSTWECCGRCLTVKN